MAENIKNSFLKESVKGGLLATLFSVLFVLLFAVIMRIFGIDSNLVEIVNIVIKILSVLFAIFIVVKNGEKILYKGIFIAICFLIASNLLSVVFGGQLMLGNVLKDIAICSFASFIACIIAVGRKKL